MGLESWEACIWPPGEETSGFGVLGLQPLSGSRKSLHARSQFDDAHQRTLGKGSQVPQTCPRTTSQTNSSQRRPTIGVIQPSLKATQEKGSHQSRQIQMCPNIVDMCQSPSIGRRCATITAEIKTLGKTTKSHSVCVFIIYAHQLLN